MATPHSIIAWNVDKYDQTRHDKLKSLVLFNNIDIIFLSETKVPESYLVEKFSEFHNYNFVINSNIPHQYHGVAFLIKKGISYKYCKINLGIEPRSDNKSCDSCSGRLICLEIDEKYFIVGTYVPNSGIKPASKIKQLPYRVERWDPALYSLLNNLKQIRPTMWIGDINVAPFDIDVSSPTTMKTWPGFRIEERQNMINFMKTGWVDFWRQCNPTGIRYTWVGYSTKPNYGLRLDNIIVSESMIPFVNTPFIISDFVYSDHIPVGIYIVI